MCGRASLTKTEKELEDRFQSSFYSEDLERYNPLPNYNVAPTHMHPIITNEEPNHFRFFRWGLIPFWAKDIKVGYQMINARIETIKDKSTYKSALEKRRCIVPFDGFYEWKKTDKEKIPYRIQLKDIPIFSIAGLWEKWTSPQGTDIFSFTLITHQPNEFMSSIHDRMPAILLPEYERLWLDNDMPSNQLLDVLQPVPDHCMSAYTVSPKVGNVRINDKTIIEPHPY